MGVKYLLTYISQNVSKGIFDVDIRNEVENYKKTNPGKQPTIVIDLLTIHDLFYTNNHEILLGARYNVYNDRLVRFFEEFKSLGVNLVFFSDGPIQANKIPTGLIRRNDEYTRAMKALQIIYSGVDMSTIREDFYAPSPVPFFMNLAYYAERYGELYTTTLNECDLELAEYATRNKVLAVISNDTDFLIYEGDWRFWNSRNFDIVNLRTTELNKQALRDTLGLRSDQMPIFATMSGNDYVSHDSLENFHRRIKPRNQRSYFREIAVEVKRLRCSFQSISPSDIKSISEVIFGQSRDESQLKLIQNSLDAYNYLKLRTEHRNEILRRVSNECRMTYVILTNMKYICNVYYFDLSKTDLMSYYEMIFPLMRRIMGILLKNETDDDKSRTFYCKRGAWRQFESVVLQPQYPPGEVPPLEELLCTPFESNQQLDEIRMNLLCWQISPNLTPDMIRDLTKDHVYNVVTLFYLHELKQINTSEADCLLLANYCTDDMQKSMNLLDVRQVNERDARIAFLFTIMRVSIKHCFHAVGLADFPSIITFDGLYFHKLRRDWDRMPLNDKSIVLNAYEHLRIYCK